MIRTILALIGIITLAYWVLGAQPAPCADCLLTGMPCYGSVACGLNCTCIQPNGPASRGWCN